MPENSIPIKLLWTGGWDSTFRLIQLVFLYGKTVQPYYIIDPGRNSTQLEIRAMASIKNTLSQKNPVYRQRILPTIFKELGDIQPNKTITNSYHRLRETESIAIQYEWLARFCADEKISDIEICNETAIIDKDNRTRRLINSDLEFIQTDCGPYYQMNNSAKGKDAYTIYGNFRFSIFDVTKLDMYHWSIENNMLDIMKQSWFCLMPTLFSKPCGKCHPCRVVYREGLSWRIPIMGKIRYFSWPTLRKVAKTFGLKN